MGIRGAARKALGAIALVLCVVFAALLVCNMVIIIKGELHPEMPPSVLGITPMATLSGSMSGEQEGHIEVGDLIFINKAEMSELEAGDVISFMEGEIIVTHRIQEVVTAEDGAIQFITKGDANESADTRPVKESQLVGKVVYRIPKVGNFIMFMQKPLGMLLFIGVPVLLFIGYDVIRRQKIAVQDKKKAAEMEAELKRLREQAGEK